MSRIYVLWLLCMAAGVAAQTPYIEHLDLGAGLPSMDIRGLHQDRQGYLWLATPAGLASYDGYTMRQYGVADGLAEANTRAVYEDGKGRIWALGERAGLAVREAGKFRRHRLSAGLEELARGRAVAAFDINAGDSLWVAFCQKAPFQADYKLYYAAESDSVWRVYDSVNVGNNAPISAMYLYEVNRSQVQPAQAFLLGQHEGDKSSQAAFVSEDAGAFQRLTAAGNCHCALGGGNLYCLSGRFWASYTRSGQLLAGDSLAAANRPAGELRQLYLDREGNAWAASSGGLYFWAKGAFGGAAKHYFEGYDVQRIFQDREGNYWIGTRGNGLIFMPSLHIQVQSVSPYPQQNQLLKLVYSPPFVQTLSAAGMVYKLTPQTVLPTYYNQSASPASAWWYEPAKKEFWLGNGRSIEAESGNKAWNWWNEAQGEINATAFGRASERAAIVALSAGFLLVDIQTHQQIWSSAQAGFAEQVRDICETGGDLVLLGTARGLYDFVPSTQSITLADSSLVGVEIQQILKQGEQYILATNTAGLWFGQPNNWQRIGLAQGLSSDCVHSIYSESADSWWVATNKGLDRLKINGQNATIQHYSHRNGLPHKGIRDILATPDGRLWLATDAGIISFFPQDVESGKMQAPNVYIEQFAVNGQTKNWNDSLTLNYGENNIQLSYLGINFRERGALLYRYRLEGLDTNWQITRERSIQYTRLPEGDYTFWVASQSGDGAWSPNPAKVQFTILAPFWKTSIFVWSLAGAGFLIFAIAIWIVRRRARTQRELWASRQNALHAQMNPHFIFNAMNSILFFVRQNDKRQATAFLSSFSSLIRRILDSSKKSLIDLDEEIDMLQRYLDLELLRLSNPDDNFRIEVSPDIDPKSWRLPPMLIQPLIENSIVHGLVPKTEGLRDLLVSFRIVRKKLCITVEDNGIGRKASAEIRARRNITHTSYGSQNIEARIRVLNQIHGKKISIDIQDLHDNTGAPAGTRIQVWIPQLGGS